MVYFIVTFIMDVLLTLPLFITYKHINKNNNT